MIYSGQEMPNYKRLKFFEKDDIDWTGNFELHNFYKTLLTLRKNNSALRAGDTSSVTIKLPTNHDDKILAFLRSRDDDDVLVILNFSPVVINLDIKNINGSFKNVFSNESFNVVSGINLQIEEWGYFVFEKLK